MTEPLIKIPGYRIERILGQGGMAIVYLATQESLHRYVALKVMKSALVTDPDFRLRFLNEGRIIAQLHHPNIVTVFDIGVHGDIYYLSMAYLPGGTLGDKISQGLPLEQGLAIIRRLADALGYAHRCGFIHRDIKPINVLFHENGLPVLTDFGIAKALGVATQITAAGIGLGSVGYMSPEQAMSKAVDSRSDIYSFGILIWKILTGQKPYEAEDAFALAMQHVTADIPKLPQDLTVYQPMMNKLLAKAPEDRYASAEDFIAALDEIELNPSQRIKDETDNTIILSEVATEKTLKTTAAKVKSGKLFKIGLTIGILLSLLTGAFVSGWIPWPPETERLQQQEAAKKAELKRQAEEQQAELKRQAEAQQKQAELKRQAEEQQAELKRQAEAQQKQAELKRQAEEQQKQAELKRQAEEQQKQAELKRQAEEQQKQAELERARQTEQERLTALLKRAEAQWQDNKLTEPVGDNAFESYQQVLKLQPDHQEAKTRLTESGRIRLASRYLSSAEQLFYSGALAESLAKIKLGLRLAPEYPGLLALQGVVQAKLADNTEQDQITQLLEQAQRQWQNAQLTEPPGDNAFESYRRVLELQPQHKEARDKLVEIGRIRLGRQYQTKAIQLLQAGALEESLAKIKTGLRVAPNYAGLLELQKQVLKKLAETQP